MAAAPMTQGMVLPMGRSSDHTDGIVRAPRYEGHQSAPLKSSRGGSMPALPRWQQAELKAGRQQARQAPSLPNIDVPLGHGPGSAS